MRRTQKLSLTAVMGATAIVISLMKIEIPFPILYYLKIDFAEIPVYLTYFLVGAKLGILCGSFHFMGLVLRSGDVLGPLMKYLAEISNILGMFIGARISKIGKRRVVEIGTGILSRIFIMSISNLLVLGVLFPSYLYFSKMLLEKSGLYIASLQEALYYTLIIVALFNTTNSVLSVIPALLAYKSIGKRLKLAP